MARRNKRTRASRPKPKAGRKPSKVMPKGRAAAVPVRGGGRAAKVLPKLPPPKPREFTASDGSIWVVKRIGDEETIVLKTKEATRKPRLKRADFVWNPFYRSFKKNKKPAAS